MSSFSHRLYGDAHLDLEPRIPEGYSVKVSYLLPSGAAKILNRGDSYSSSVVNSQKKYKEYKTLPYATPQEAFIHAKGWLDCMSLYYSFKQIYPDENEDSYKKAYEENLKWHKENRDHQDKDSSASENELELAYKQGWDKKLSELKKIDGDVGA